MEQGILGPRPDGSHGEHLWSKSFGSSLGQYGRAVAVDAAGSVVVAGEFQHTVDFGGGPLDSGGPYNGVIFVAKFDADGKHLWSKRFGGETGAYAYAVAVDPAGNILLSGQFSPTIDFGGGELAVPEGVGGICLAKLGSYGQHIWSKAFAHSGFAAATSVVVDGSGNVLLGGSFDSEIDFGGVPLQPIGNPSYYEAFFVKLDEAGNHLWGRAFGDPTGAADPLGVAADAAGNVLLAGWFSRTIWFGGDPFYTPDDGDAFVAKFAP
ncbi:MAG: hypothetical protein HY744_21210 [Deltaproteobacteria bacterium]|nr:hypothetical protein [Deltaproteobacteria bacterium]